MYISSCPRAGMSAAEVMINRGMYEFKPFTIKQLSPRTSVAPMGRSGHRIVSDNACVYSFGGFNPNADEDDEANGDGANSKLFKELWKFNIGKLEWERLDHFSDSMPQQLASNAVLRKGDFIIVHGGTGMPFGLSNTNQTYIANLKSGTSFSMIPAEGNPPTAKYGQAMVLDGHRLYVVGGTNGLDYFVDIHCLNLENMVWQEIYLTREIYIGEPEGRYRHEIALQDSRIMMFGGGTDIDVFRFDTVPAFNLETGNWETITTFRNKKPVTCFRQWFPPARRCHGCVHVPGDEEEDPEVVICGGFDGIEILSDIWRLNLRTFDWILCECSLPNPLYFHSTSLSPNGQMFLFGGIREDEIGGETYTIRTNEMFSLWVRIPKLKEMCWEAILHYSPDVVKFPNSELMRAGIPQDFVQRLNS